MSQPVTEAGGSFGRVSLVDIDRPVGGHAHPQCHALFKLGGVDTVFEVDGRRYPMRDGSAILVNAWQPHAYPFEARRPGAAQVLALYIEPAWLERVDPWFGASARRDFFPAGCIAVPPRIRVLSSALAEELRGSRADPSRACTLVRQLMAALAVDFSRFRDFPAWARHAAAAVSDHRIRKAMRIIGEQAHADLDLAEVARSASLSRPHFFELFRRSLGVTPGVYRNVVRMESAYRALLRTDQAIGHIGAALGFSAHAHFTRFFRENHGVSPDAYRRAAWRIEA
jgi:AraC family transcriptional regulator